MSCVASRDLDLTGNTEEMKKKQTERHIERPKLGGLGSLLENPSTLDGQPVFYRELNKETELIAHRKTRRQGLLYTTGLGTQV